MSKRKDTNTPNQAGEQQGNTPADALTRMDELVKRREQINQRIAGIQSAYDETYADQQRLRTSMIDLKNHLLDIPVRGISKNDEQYYAEKKQVLDAKLQQAEQDFAQAEDERKKLDEELKQLQTIELPACMVAVCAEDVMEHQRQIKRATISVASIQAAIVSQNHLLAETRAAIPKASDRQQLRHNIMADIALGNASDDELKKLDAATAEDKKIVTAAENKAAPLIESAQATLSGLKHKLTAAHEALIALESKSSEVAHRYFMGEAGKAAAQYVNHAMHMKELYLRLIGLNWVTLQYDKRGFTVPYAGEIKIPMFRLPQFDGLGNPSRGDWMLLDGEKIINDQVAQAAKAEQARFDAILDGHVYQ